MELKKYRLGDIAEIIGGVSYSPKDICTGGIRILRGGNIQNQHIELKTDDVFLPISYKNNISQIYVGDTILVASTGSVDVLGKAATCFQYTEDVQIGAFLRIIRPKADKYTMLISSALSSDYFKRYIKAQAKGTSINNITLGYLRDFEIYAPHDFTGLSHLSANIENKICLNRAINDNLEAMAKQLYDYWFVQFDFPNEDGKPYKSSGGAMVWNERLKREIPVGWQVENLIDFAEIKNGATPSTTDDANYGGNIVWITPKDLSDQQSKFVYQGERNITKQGFDSCSTSMLPTNSVLMSSRAPIGLVSIAKHEVCTNQGFKSFIPKNIENSIYLYYYIKHHIKQIEQLGTGTTFKEVSRDDLCKFPILVVGANETYKQWIELQDKIANKQFVLKKEIAALTKQRDELLPLLMNGQASVNSD